VFELCAQKSGNLVTTRVLPSTGTKKTPPSGPRRPKDPRRKGFASFARVYTSSSAPQCERKTTLEPRGGLSYDQISKFAHRATMRVINPVCNDP
jgi:hypothetical protein